ncbi:hypothetical protein EDD69_10872 [Thermolongibacillus altinsuensis]|jgi:hypothetical protein|uniref:Uncharacterized protein n=1 Tax=Thermolongibacillus altinsuensis TaxID=575256 RepID=A0A4R1QGW4_9BACL|nr:hypothetical protein [Thermolongibacillus altinsuensis]TCL48815.1 hypothetical protein EDD69_10872 [Thermolongibacillus altinsuensis]
MKRSVWVSFGIALIMYYFRYRLLNCLLRNESMRKTLVGMVMGIPFVRQRMVVQLFSSRYK